MKSFCIAMEHETARRAFVEREFAQCGMDVEFFTGVDGRKSLTKEQRSYLSIFARYFGHPSVVGCGMSHVMLWEKILRITDEELFFICESDVKLEDSFSKRLQDCMQETDEPFDVLFVGNKNFYPDDKSLARKVFASMLFSGKMKQLSATRFVPDISMATHAYIITKEGARKLLEKVRGRIGEHIDFLIQHVGGMQLQSVYPPLARQQTCTSQGSSMFSKHKFPQTFNHIMDTGHEDGFTPTYWLSCPVAQVFDQPINFWTLIYLIIGVLCAYFSIPILFILVILIAVVLGDTLIMQSGFKLHSSQDPAYILWVITILILPTLLLKARRHLKD